MTTPIARCTADHLVDQAVCQAATNAFGDVVWLGAGPSVKVLTSQLAPVVGFELGTSGAHVTSLAVAGETVAVVSATTLELYALVGRSIAELDLPESSGFARAAFTADGRTLVWCGSDHEGRVLNVQIIDATTGEVTASISLPCAEPIESCTVFPAGDRGVLVAGWEPDGEHCNVVARVDADTGTLTALDGAAGFSVIGASPTGEVALIVPHGSDELFRLDLASGGVRPWLTPIEPADEDHHVALDENSGAVFLDERLVVVSSEYEDPVLLDLRADDGSPRRLRLESVAAGPSFVCRLGRRAFLTAEAARDGARLRVWEVG